MAAGKAPPANTSPQAVALRKAAAAWAARLRPKDDHDSGGVRLNRELLAAAIAYARVADDLYRRAGLALGAMDRGVTDGSAIDSGWFEFLDEYDVRSIVCELLGHKPGCHDTKECEERSREHTDECAERQERQS